MNPQDAETIIGGRYRIVRSIGRGGMAEVFEAVHIGLGEHVAIKRLMSNALAAPTMVERFYREAQAAARLKTEHAVRVTDVGVADDGQPYMVMELLAGQDLGDADDFIQYDHAVDYVIQAADALGEAHSLGIIHRDVKPANLFLAEQPDGSRIVKVLDFGISKATVDDRKLTATDFTFGTPMYMAPEQMRSARNADQRSDIWSLGVVLYELIEAAMPFGGETYAEIVLRVTLDDPHPMMQAVPPGLARVVQRCLAKQPELRFQSMAELVEVLVPYAADGRRAWQCAERAVRIEKRATAAVRPISIPPPIAVARTVSGREVPPAEAAIDRLRHARKRVALKPLTRPVGGDA